MPETLIKMFNILYLYRNHSYKIENGHLENIYRTL